MIAPVLEKFDGKISKLNGIKIQKGHWTGIDGDQCSNCGHYLSDIMDADSYYVEKCNEIIDTREKTAKAMAQLGLAVIPSQTNFLFIHAGAIGGEKMYLELKKRAILVRHFSAPRTKDYVRVTIGTPAEMETFTAAVKDILNQ